MPEWTKTKSLGVRYRLHKTRKHGVGYDRYYVIRYKINGKDKGEGVGWASEGWNEKKAAAVLAELRANQVSGTPPFTLEEKRQAEQNRRDAEARQARAEKDYVEQQENNIINKIFIRYCEANERKASLQDEQAYYKNWIGPTIGKKKLKDVVLLDLQRIAKKMTDAGRAPRSIQYVKSIVRQLYHYAIDHKLYSGVVPTTSFLRKQKIDNRRQRYLDPEDAERLLAEVRIKSETTYRISLISLHGGLRFGEIAALRWQHINTDRREILIVDSKSGESRTVYMTDKVLAMFVEMDRREPNMLVFPARMPKGEEKEMSRISNVFTAAVDALGLNNGITDRRMKLVFHSLRHSCASTLVNAGIELPVIAKILGHKTLTMTMRYSHVNDLRVRNAMGAIDAAYETKEPVLKLQKQG